MDPKTVTEILALMKKAKKKMAFARKYIDGGDYDDVVSRVYYGCYHAAQALLLTEGLKARTHRGLKNLFGLHFVQAGKIEREYAMILDELQHNRENGDYEVFIEFTHKEAEESLAKAEKFLKRIDTSLGAVDDLRKKLPTIL